jgi:hypothetical protein
MMEHWCIITTQRRKGSWWNIGTTILPVEKSLKFRCLLEKRNVVMTTFRDAKTIHNPYGFYES